MEPIAGGIVAIFGAIFAFFFLMMMMFVFFELVAMFFMMIGMFFMLFFEILLIPFSLLEFAIVLLVSVFTREDSLENRILCFLGTAVLSGGIVFGLVAYFTGMIDVATYGGIAFGAVMGIINACSIPSSRNGPTLRISRRFFPDGFKFGSGSRKKDRF